MEFLSKRVYIICSAVTLPIVSILSFDVSSPISLVIPTALYPCKTNLWKQVLYYILVFHFKLILLQFNFLFRHFYQLTKKYRIHK